MIPFYLQCKTQRLSYGQCFSIYDPCIEEELAKYVEMGLYGYKYNCFDKVQAICNERLDEQLKAIYQKHGCNSSLSHEECMAIYKLGFLRSNEEKNELIKSVKGSKKEIFQSLIQDTYSSKKFILKEKQIDSNNAGELLINIKKIIEQYQILLNKNHSKTFQDLYEQAEQAQLNYDAKLTQREQNIYVDKVKKAFRREAVQKLNCSVSCVDTCLEDNDIFEEIIECFESDC